MSAPYPDYLERMKEKGDCDHVKIGDGQAIRFHDRVRHAEVEAKLRQRRGV
jgi:hypothetical protein